MSRRYEVQFMLNDLDYSYSEEEELPIIRLYGKNNEGQIRITVKDFLPYIYIKKNADLSYILQNDPFLKDWIKRTEEISLRQYFSGSGEVKLVKAYGKDPNKILEMKKILEKWGFETFETDIPFLKRYLLDTAIKCLNIVNAKCSKIEQEEKYFFGEASYRNIIPLSELEDISPSSFYQLKIMAINVKIAHNSEQIPVILRDKNKRIIGITVIWGIDGKPENGKLFLLQEDSNDGEKELIQDFLQCIQTIQPDILCSYRGDSFDLPYLYSRMKILGIPNQLLSVFGDEPTYYSNRLLSYRIKGRMVYDLALRTWGIHPKSGKKDLYDIAEAVLGTTGYEQIEPLELLWFSGIMEDCEDDLRLFAKQCFQDCKIIYDLF
ncbi:MAG: 3'-5' exonuclease, partial [Candidatus Thorarchaeota archaeon]